MAVLVAVGAVSGTLLSFEMGLLWPGLMGKFGGAIGIPFSVEGIFFLLEAVFVAIYLFRLGSPTSVAALLVVGACGALGDLRRMVGRRRQLVDEPTGRLQTQPRPRLPDQPVRRLLQQRLVV